MHLPYPIFSLFLARPFSVQQCATGSANFQYLPANRYAIKNILLEHLV
ncbi:hypothetical protein GCHA_3632 [Paraglaciecola chathamensis S18K6]|uniref:Uncharacterized protein n=1 Tax=Paraglaciecola chathamensis S18K6 TaxID=1127672 RepID=A0AAV3V4D6_9ALTE|nr:hypothetical protein GCHA_3632 [Paraglaciecola chathamensis S18K6]